MRIAISEVVLENRSTGTRQRDLNLLPALLRHLRSEGHEPVVYFASDLSENLAQILTGEPPLAEVVRAPFASQPTHKRLVSGARYFRQEMRTRHIDVFHSNYFPLPPLSVPTVLTVNDVRFVHFPETYTRGRLAYLRVVVPIALRQATRIAAISSDTKNDLVKHFGVPEGRIDVVPVPAAPGFVRETDPARLQAVRAKYNLPETYILYVGYLEPRKNLLRLVQAYRSVYEQDRATPPLVILGKQAFGFESVLDFARGAGLEQQIYFAGYVAEEDLAAAYTLARVLAFPSLHEGFGVPVLEAMACGVPVLTSNTTALPEVAGDAAVLADPYSVESIAHGLASLLRDEGLRATMIKRGLRRVAHFSPEQSAAVMLECYLRAHAAGRKRASGMSSLCTELVPLRVLHPITRLIIGGAQENTMLTADLLDKRTWAVDVLCGPQTGSEGSLIEAVRERGTPLFIEPALVREISPFKDLLALVRLTQRMRRGGYVVVHTHSSKAGILGRWAAWLARVPVIVHTVHGWGHHERQHPLMRAAYVILERLSLLITDRLIVVSPQNVDKGLADGIGAPADYVVIRSGIELERFGHPQVARDETRRAWGIPLYAPVVGTVTRLSTQKAPLDFVRAASCIAQTRPDVWFIMVGDGDLRPQVEALATELGIRDRLVLTGLRRDVPELMAAFDIFALSSLWEGLPRVLPQAMATGLPIVATAADGTAEAVTQGVNGFLTPPGDPQILAGMVLQLLQNPALAQQMGAAGRARVDEFSDTRMVAQIDALYRELLAAKGIHVPKA